jgi:hypothetical protein
MMFLQALSTFASSTNLKACPTLFGICNPELLALGCGYLGKVGAPGYGLLVFNDGLQIR